MRKKKRQKSRCRDEVKDNLRFVGLENGNYFMLFIIKIIPNLDLRISKASVVL